MSVKSPVSSIFVYGTLKREQIRGRHWPRQPIVVFDRFVIGELYDLGPYPALVLGEGVVAGELWQFAGEDMAPTLAVLDEIEGYFGPAKSNLYEREVVSVYPTAGSAHSAIDAGDSPGNDVRYAYVYHMARARLPQSAVKVVPTIPDGSSGFSVAIWPANNASPGITHRKPDPFADWFP